jgi:pyruvate formate lyase activating enzyme
VGDWVCPGGTGAGYPRYAYRSGPEYGYKNLAVFFGACSFSCLFCQNWHYKNLTHRLAPLYSYKELVGLVDRTTSCVCFFGGDPSPQMPFALRASREALEKFSGKILRICWETNGSFHPRFLNEIANVSIASGGCIKFDLKAFNENLHRALTGVSNKITLRNFESLAQYLGERPDPPFLIASTLLVPGYITPQEVRRIAQFLTRLDPTIPYSLLAFYPAFQFSDLPTTSRQMAEECLEAAKEAGLTRVHLGNVHLLT